MLPLVVTPPLVLAPEAQAGGVNGGDFLRSLRRWRDLRQHRTSVLKTLKRLRAQGSVEAREVATHNRGGRRILFRIAEESTAKPWLPAITW
jgi:hypothetical protein